MIYEIIKFLIYSILIVVVAKYVLVKALRRIAENLNLSSKVVGNVAGTATSVPELLTVSIASFSGLIEISVFNILISNIINLIQYFGTIILNKNFKLLKNKALIFDMFLVFITICIPLLFIVNRVTLNINFIPAFIILYFLFIYLNARTHICYLNIESDNLKKKNNDIKNIITIIIDIFVLILSVIILFFISNRLEEVLKNLCFSFKISQTIVGILLGVITSIPELITFFESQKYYKKQNDEILGVVEATNNLLSSNILNLFLIQSVGIFIVTVFQEGRSFLKK
ncbi:MAG: hypothetical protein IJH39_09770 [Clostridia bacterium]|nr:hypothetical protein [Clostridia bacterium]